MSLQLFKRQFLVVFFLVMCLAVAAQNDTVPNTPPARLPKSKALAEGRKVLLDYFLEGDYVKVRETKDYLMQEVDDQHYAAFYPVEYWLLLYWTGEYEALLESIRKHDSGGSISFSNKTKPPTDLLFQKVGEKSITSRSNLITFVEISDLGETEKDFLLLNLEFILSRTVGAEVSQDSLNVGAEHFMAKHPGSSYEPFTRNHIRIKYIPSSFGYAGEFFSGYGIFTGGLASKYTNNVPVGIAFDIQVQQFVLYLRDYIGFSSTKNDVQYTSGVWEKGSQVRVFLPEASLGYIVKENDRVRVAPFAGIASMSIGPTDYDVQQTPSLREVEANFTVTYLYGFNLDLKLGKPKLGKSRKSIEQTFRFVRLRYGHTLPQFEKHYTAMDGNMHYITIGIGGFSRKMKREY